MHNTNKQQNYAYIRDWQKKNPEKVRLYQKNSRERHKDSYQIKKKEWRDKNREKVLLIQRAWREKNKNKIREYSKKWKLENPLKAKYKKYKYSSPKRGYKFNLSYEEFVSILNNAECYYCGTNEVNLGLDRMNNSIGYEFSNVVPCCWNCNKAKRVLSKEAFVKICISVAKNQNNLPG